MGISDARARGEAISWMRSGLSRGRFYARTASASTNCKSRDPSAPLSVAQPVSELARMDAAMAMKVSERALPVTRSSSEVDGPVARHIH